MNDGNPVRNPISRYKLTESHSLSPAWVQIQRLLVKARGSKCTHCFLETMDFERAGSIAFGPTSIDLVCAYEHLVKGLTLTAHVFAT